MFLHENETITIVCGEQRKTVELKEQGQMIEGEFALEPGINTIEILSNAPRVKVDPAKDSRSLYFTLQDFTITDNYNNCQISPFNIR